MRTQLKQRVLLLDGAMGTQIQRYGLEEKDFRGEIFAAGKKDLKGNNDLLVLTRPDVIKDIHRAYLEAGADIIETCTFNSQRISQADYGTEDFVERINLEGARLAREVADEFTQRDPSRPRFVAGSVGPTTKLLSISDDADNPGTRSISYEELKAAYVEQMRPLIRGGVDALLIETALDPINAKAALDAAEDAMEAEGRRVELMVSATVTDEGGRVLSGQNIEAFAIAMSHAQLLSIGLNCSVGPASMLAPLRRLTGVAPFYVSVHPNAGHPNSLGEYDETPESMTAVMQRFVDEGLVNIIGGCCGTTPEHIAAFRRMLDDKQPTAREVPELKPELRLSGLEPLEADGFFVNVGERCNVAGSRKFLRLINEKKYGEALEIARKQVEAGAMVIDVNMDEGLLDAEHEMTTFLNLLSAEPDIAKVPVMIDSSRFQVIEGALKCLQGKGIVNSISLKEGEEEFLRKARKLRRLGAAVVVMAFDENGQATTYDRKIEICARAYDLLTREAGFNPSDIIFDPNILTVATGMDEHLDYAYDFVRATEWIRANLPGCGVSGGVSNLSFAFRGNNPLREAMHAVFLYHAVKAGMTMAIMNPSTAVSYDDIDPELRAAIEDVLFFKRTHEATEHLMAMQTQVANDVKEKSEAAQSEHLSVEERLQRALIKGDSTNLQADLKEALEKYPKVVDIISGPLMQGMDIVGARFGEGKMFLPQVVKTARTMKRAVDILQPYLEASGVEAESIGNKPKVLLATVKGDVHDIGKNIVGVILACNNLQVIDLGVMVPPEKIVETALKERPAFIGLSGLITPSLDAMVTTARMLAEAGVDAPLMIGGAATSPMHTAVKIAPVYKGLAIHVADASQNPVIAAKLLAEEKDEFETAVRGQQAELVGKYERKQAQAPTAEQARQHRVRIDWDGYLPKAVPFAGPRDFEDIPLSELRPLIDWLYFFHAWKVKEESEEGRKLRLDVESLLDELMANPRYHTQARVMFMPAKGNVADDCIELGDDKLATRRKEWRGKGSQAPALCDFVSPEGDHIGMFAATVSKDLVALLEESKQSGDDYRSMLLQTLMDRLAEATSEWVHRTLQWDSIRPAVGYPSLPDQSNIFVLDRYLTLPSLGIKLTETGAMYPQASVAGLYISHPEAFYF